MRKFAAISLIAILSACGKGSDSKVVGPEDYALFSDIFTMDESTEIQMNMDGGTAMMPPKQLEPDAAILSGEIEPDDQMAQILSGQADGSPAVRLAN